MIPVIGDSKALVQRSAGSIAVASSRVSTRIPSTPFVSARCLMPASIASSCSLVATISLPQFSCGTPFSSAVGIQLAPPLDAEPRHQAVGGIVNAGVDHLAVARGRFGADPLRRLQDDHFPARQGQRARHRETDDPGTDNDAIHFLHARTLFAARRTSATPLADDRRTG